MKTMMPFSGQDKAKIWEQRGVWPAMWLEWPGGNACVYRREFTVSEPKRVRLHVSGDNKYRLRLDGREIARGPESGDLENYFFETVELDLTPGRHVLAALVYDFGKLTAYCHLSLAPGWLAAAEGEEPDFLNTGRAPWEVQSLAGIEFIPLSMIYPGVELNAEKFPAAALSGEGDGWIPATASESPGANAGIRNEYPRERLLRPATLPPRRFEKCRCVEELFVFSSPDDPVRLAEHLAGEAPAWRTALDGGKPVTLPPHTTRRILGRLDRYHCLYPQLHAKGQAAKITLRWAEGLFNEDSQYGSKGKRTEIDGKFFHGRGDVFLPSPKEFTFFTPWWRCGLYFELTVSTGAEPAVIGELELFDTSYPLTIEAGATTSDMRLNRILPMCLRTLEMCMHETFVDCPFYEQLMYIGDSRLEALLVMTVSHDYRMVEKMLRMFAASAGHDGLPASRYPSRIRQVIPTFAPFWIGALHDFAMYGGDPKLVAELLGPAKRIIDAFQSRLNRDGLIEFTQGWNFVDWTPDWCSETNRGIPPHGEYGVSGIVNWLYVYALKHLAELCDFAGQRQMGDYYRQEQHSHTARIVAAFWDGSRNLFADDLEKQYFSEHAQCLALLCGGLDPEKADLAAEALFLDPALSRTSIYFSFYYFECCRLRRRMDAFFDRMQLWFDCDGLGLSTLLEQPEPSRSDCHAWSSHPYYHAIATLAGIRPGEFGYRSVKVTPQPGELTSLRVKTTHPRGIISAEYHLANGVWHGRVILPPGLSGEAELPQATLPLNPGENNFDWEEEDCTGEKSDVAPSEPQLPIINPRERL